MVDFFKKLDAHDFFERNGDIYIKSSYIKDFISIVLNRRLKILQLEIFNLGNNTIQPDMQNIFYSGDFNDDYYEQNF